MNASCSTTPSAAENDSTLRVIDASCRPPLVFLFCGAALWLVVAWAFALIAGLKFHSPNFLANCSWLTYGRVYPVSTNALLYGFAIPAGLGVGLWILARLGRTTVVQPWIIAFGAKLWHFGVFVGLVEILRGNSTGFEGLEIPKAGAILMFLGYMLIGIWSLLTLYVRTERTLSAPQWFIIAALFWFPWIFTTAHLLLTVFPVRGVTQSIIVWWFSGNLRFVWLALVGLGAIFYLTPLLMKRTLHSEYLALFTFWTIILFASWNGIPQGAPVPAWMPALSTVTTVLTLVTLLTFAVNIYRTCGNGCSTGQNPVEGKFIAFGSIAFVIAVLMSIVGLLRELNPLVSFTWFTVAQADLNVFGFFSMTMIGAILYITPRVTGFNWACSNKAKASFWLAAAGIVLYTVSLAAGGVMQGVKLNNPQIAFNEVSRASLMPLRMSTLGQLLILTASVLLLWNLVGVLVRIVKAQVNPVNANSVAAAEVKS